MGVSDSKMKTYREKLAQQNTKNETKIVPRNEKHSDILLKNYPFLIAHDAATGSPGLAKFLPYTRCQKYDFAGQYTMGGARAFDLRVRTVIVDGQKTLKFHHGPIDVGLVQDDMTFKKMLLRAIADKQVIMLLPSHDTSSLPSSAQQIEDMLIDIITVRFGILPEFIANKSSLANQLDTVRFKKVMLMRRYIVVRTNLRDNYHGELSCIKKDSAHDMCKDSCFGSDFFKNRQIQAVQNQMQIDLVNNQNVNGFKFVQAMWQASAQDEAAIQKSILCHLDMPTLGIAIAETIKSQINQNMIVWLTDNACTKTSSGTLKWDKNAASMLIKKLKGSSVMFNAVDPYSTRPFKLMVDAILNLQ